MTSTYSFLSRPFYNSSQQCYQKVISVTPAPKGALSKICKRVSFDKMSPFDQPTCCENVNRCGYLLIDPNNHCNYASIDDLASIFTWLVNNGYTIDTSITNMMTQSQVRMSFPIICFVTG